MINFYIKWALLNIKQCVKRLSFYAMTLLMALGFWLADSVIHEYNSDIVVPIYNDNGYFGQQCEEKLIENAPKGFAFYKAESEESVKKSVKRGENSCGIILEKGNTIKMYRYSGSSDGYVIREIVFPVIDKLRTDEYLERYLADISEFDEDYGYIPNDEACEYTLSRLDYYLDTMDVDIVDVVNVDLAADHNVDISEVAGPSDATLKRTIYAVILIILTVVMAVDTWGSDRGFYKAVPGISRVILKLEKIIISMILSGIIAVVISRIFLQIL